MASLDYATIRALLSEHRQNQDDEIVARPGGGWLIITASHVLPDGRMDEEADTSDCLAMYTADRKENWP